MSASVDIFANIVLSSNGEDIHINAAGNKLTVIFPSLRSGLCALMMMNANSTMLKSIHLLDVFFKRQNLTAYVNCGWFGTAVLGSNASSKIRKILIQIVNIGKTIGLI